MRDISEGRWFDIRDFTDFDDIILHGSRSEKSFRADLRIGKFISPGWYLLIGYANYTRRHGNETVHEMLPASAVVEECQSQIDDLVCVLKSARKKQGES